MYHRVRLVRRFKIAGHVASHRRIERSRPSCLRGRHTCLNGHGDIMSSTPASARPIVKTSDSTLEMKVAIMTFMLERLAQDCAPLQFVRELTQNSIDSIKQHGQAGEVRWDVD